MKHFPSPSTANVEPLELQRNRLQRELQLTRQQMIRRLQPLHETPADYPRSMTVRFLSNPFASSLILHYVLSQARQSYPKLLAISQVVFQHLHRHPSKPEVQ